MQQLMQVPQLPHLTLTLPIVNSMTQQRRVVRRIVYLTAIVPQQPLHTIVAIHLVNQVISIIVFLLGYSYKYCTNSNATTCASTPTDTSYTSYCKFYGSTKMSCKTHSVSYRYCASTTTAYDSCHTSRQSSDKYYCVFVGYVHTGQNMYIENMYIV